MMLSVSCHSISSLDLIRFACFVGLGDDKEETVDDEDANLLIETPQLTWSQFLFPSSLLKDLTPDQRKLLATPYDSFLSNDCTQHAILIMGATVFMYVFISLF